MSLETPYFLIYQEQLEKNINEFKEGMRKNWPTYQMSYSVKTNSLPWILKYMRLQGILAEVVSDEEYELAQLCGFSDDSIIFNGPIKTKERFLWAINHGAYVNIDSKREIEWLKSENVQNANIGFRINIPPELFSSNDIAYEEDGFRFGFSEQAGDFLDVIKTVQTASHEGKVGLHLHCNSITRSPEVYRAISRYAVDLADRYSLQLRYIDVGGGFFGGVAGKATPMEYFSIIKEELGKSNRTEGILLIAEPGSALVGSVIDLHTSVLDVKDTEKARIVTSDGSRIHIDPLWKKERYMYSLVSKNKVPMNTTQIICGYTCMDHDRIMKINKEPELSTGDQIIYHRVGAYSMTFGGLFIRYYPDVYVINNGKMEKVRERISVKEYYNLQTK